MVEARELGLNQLADNGSATWRRGSISTCTLPGDGSQAVVNAVLFSRLHLTIGSRKSRPFRHATVTPVFLLAYVRILELMGTGLEEGCRELAPDITLESPLYLRLTMLLFCSVFLVSHFGYFYCVISVIFV